MSEKIVDISDVSVEEIEARLAGAREALRLALSITCAHNEDAAVELDKAMDLPDTDLLAALDLHREGTMADLKLPTVEEHIDALATMAMDYAEYAALIRQRDRALLLEGIRLGQSSRLNHPENILAAHERETGGVGDDYPMDCPPDFRTDTELRGSAVADLTPAELDAIEVDLDLHAYGYAKRALTALRQTRRDTERLEFWFQQHESVFEGPRWRIYPTADGRLFNLDQYRTAEERLMDRGDWLSHSTHTTFRAAIDAARAVQREAGEGQG